MYYLLFAVQETQARLLLKAGRTGETVAIYNKLLERNCEREAYFEGLSKALAHCMPPTYTRSTHMILPKISYTLDTIPYMDTIPYKDSYIYVLYGLVHTHR